MSKRLPEFYVTIAVVVVVGNFIWGEVLFGLVLGAVLLVSAYVLHQRGVQRRAPRVPPTDVP